MRSIIWFYEGLIEFKTVLKQLIWQQLTLRYRRTALGFLWTLINPLLTMTVITVVFSTIMRIPLQSFAVFLYSGLVPWTFFATACTAGAGSLVAAEGLIKKVYIPRQIFVVSTLTGLLVDTLFSTVALFAIVTAIGAKISPALLLLPISFAILYAFTLGTSLILSVATVFFRDVPNLIGIALQAGYYLTPIIYPLEMVPPQYQWIFKINPMYYVVDLFRQPIYYGKAPSIETYVLTTLGAIFLLLAGIHIFRMKDKHVVFRL